MENNRDYQYGRLLAIYEKIEEDINALDDELNLRVVIQREFNFRPFTTWSNIENRLSAYYRNLPKEDIDRYKKMISEISDFLSQDDSSLNKQLSPNYLLGYYSERDKLRG